MKRYYKIAAVTFLSIIISACEDNVSVDRNDNEIDINLPSRNYIVFQTEVNTKAALVEDKYISDDFGVYAYQYDFGKSWNGQRFSNIIPNVFWNVSESIKKPLKVTESGGFYTYNASNADDGDAGQIQWSGNKYAFFGYYPYEHPSMTLSGMEAEGAPYITYTVNKSDATQMVDLLTGGISEITAASTNNTVTFSMSHRLAGVDVSICNAYQYTYQSAVDGEGKPVYTQEPIDIEIYDLTVEFSNLTYDKAKIFLEQNKAVPGLNTKPENVSGTTASYKLIGTGSNTGKAEYTVNPTIDENTIITAETGTSMTFIPQTENLSVKTTITYKKKRTHTDEYIREGEDEEGNPLYDSNGYYTVVKNTSFDQPLREGSRYFVLLTFTSEAVSINIITTEAWDETEVEYEFV